jgi:hypothetical protein
MTMSEPSLRDTAIEQAHRVIGPGTPQAAAGAAIGVDAALRVIRERVKQLRTTVPSADGETFAAWEARDDALCEVLATLGAGDAA